MASPAAIFQNGLRKFVPLCLACPRFMVVGFAVTLGNGARIVFLRMDPGQNPSAVAIAISRLEVGAADLVTGRFSMYSRCVAVAKCVRRKFFPSLPSPHASAKNQVRNTGGFESIVPPPGFAPAVTH